MTNSCSWFIEEKNHLKIANVWNSFKRSFFTIFTLCQRTYEINDSQEWNKTFSIIYFFVADTEILNSQLSMELGQKNCSDDLCMDSSSLAILGEPSLHVDQVSLETKSEVEQII